LDVGTLESYQMQYRTTFTINKGKSVSNQTKWHQSSACILPVFVVHRIDGSDVAGLEVLLSTIAFSKLLHHQLSEHIRHINSVSLK